MWFEPFLPSIEAKSMHFRCVCQSLDLQGMVLDTKNGIIFSHKIRKKIKVYGILCERVIQSQIGIQLHKFLQH